MAVARPEKPGGRRRASRTLASRLGAILGAFALAVGPAHGQTAGELEASKTARQPLAPEASLTALRVAPGFRVELAASEPEVRDPVAVRFDERHRMWVVEMGDYPGGPANGRPPASRIKILTDANGDGYYESVQIFADGLLFATGVQPYRNGAFVTCAGKVLWLGDQDQDGVSDPTQVWYDGFAQQNPQLRANHPRLAIDGWIDVANGLRGGSVIARHAPDAKPVSISGMDFRFHPQTREYQAETGVGQFGLTHDDFGRRFVCSNRNPVKHIVLSNRHLKRAPGVAIAATSQDVAAWGEESRLYPRTRAWTTSTQHAGQFTAACGVLVYRGDASPELYGDALVCDPTGALVHRETLRTSGPTFVSTPARKGVEFLTSTDEWFRPVNLSNGPDGALYVVDMCRAVIEHPQFMPDELKSRPDLAWGTEHGRVYRIVPEQARPAREPLSRDDHPGLLAALASGNGWTRDTAARLIREQPDFDVASLRQVANSAPLPASRATALWLLRDLDAPEALPAALRTAISDDSPDVRATAARIAGRWRGEEKRRRDSSPLEGALFQAMTDPSAEVRFEAMLALSPLAPAKLPELAEVALEDAADPWMRSATRLAAAGHTARFAGNVIKSAAAREAIPPGVGELLSECFADLPRDSKDAAPLGSDLAQAAERHGHSFPFLKALAGWLQRFGREGLSAIPPRRREQLAEWSRREFLAGRGPEPRRTLAIRVWSYFPESAADLKQVTRDDKQPTALRIAAISALARGAHDAFFQERLETLASEPPGVRIAVVDACLGRTSLCKALLEQVRSKATPAGWIDPIRTRRLTRHPSPEIRRLAGEVLVAANPDRDAALAKYRAALQLTPDLASGRAQFRRLCTTCHRVGGDGVNVAPDIADTRTQTPLQLLTNIIQPNRAVDGAYLNYVVETRQGVVVSGLIVEENATTVTLKAPGDKQNVLRRDEIAALRSTGVSLMPEGLERDMTLQQMADLVGYLKQWRYLQQNR